MRHPHAVTSLVLATLATLPTATSRADSLFGRVTDAGATPLSGARVTLVDPGGTFFRETRTNAAGDYALDPLPAGSYTLGASFRGHEYKDKAASVAGASGPFDFALGSETEAGKWTVIGDAGEKFGGTNSGVLMPDGRLIYCHDTQDPVVLDPVSGMKAFPPKSPRIQGCHAVTAMPDGRIIYVGGADVEVYGPGTKQVKTFDPMSFTWTVQPDMRDYRWYPTMAQLPDGELLVAGGGGLMNPVRTKTSELMTPASMAWDFVGDVEIGNEVSPVLLLYTGEVLMTHRPPQLYNPGTKTWRKAADFVQGPRTPDGNHADHEVVLLPDGRSVAIGFKSYDTSTVGKLTEIYDPKADKWSLGASFDPVRSRASILQLPDKKILVMGGEKEDASDPTPVNAWGYMALTDLYDPAADSWRRLGDLNIAREYHAMPILVPDGRVFIVGGEGNPGEEPAASTIEAFTPPYLLRGPRPEMSGLAKTTYTRGETVTFDIAKTAAPTSVILISTIATTHFMDSGNNRYLEIPFTQSGAAVTATLPTDPVRLPVGYYILFAMVDDIPSKGRIVRVVKGSPPPPADGGVTDASGGLETPPPADLPPEPPGSDPGPDGSAAEPSADKLTEPAAESADRPADGGIADGGANKDAGGDQGTRTNDGGDAGAGRKSSGCSCHLGSGRPGGAAFGFIVAVVLAVRRRRRAILTATFAASAILGVACGGSTSGLPGGDGAAGADSAPDGAGGQAGTGGNAGAGGSAGGGGAAGGGGDAGRDASAGDSPTSCPDVFGTYGMLAASGPGCGDLNLKAPQCIKGTPTACALHFNSVPPGGGPGAVNGGATLRGDGTFSDAMLIFGTAKRSGCSGSWDPGKAGMTINCGAGGDECVVTMVRSSSACL